MATFDRDRLRSWDRRPTTAGADVQCRRSPPSPPCEAPQAAQNAALGYEPYGFTDTTVTVNVPAGAW